MQVATGFSEDIGKKLMKNKQEKSDQKKLSGFQKWQEEKKKRKDEKRELNK